MTDGNDRKEGHKTYGRDAYHSGWERTTRTEDLARSPRARRRLGRLGLSQILGSATRAAAVAIVCGVAAWAVARAGHWELGGAAPLNYLVLVLAVMAGIGVYVLGSALVRSPELGELRSAFRR